MFLVCHYTAFLFNTRAMTTCVLVGVLRDGFLKIAVKTSAFMTTATGVKKAAMIEVQIKNVSYFSVISAAV